MSHTPGPWHEYQDDRQAAINGCRYVAAENFGDICEIGGGTLKERLANARLIAAAPVLLAALKSAYSLMGPQPFGTLAHEVEVKMAKAIATAEGKDGGG